MALFWISRVYLIVLWNTLFIEQSDGIPTRLRDLKHHVFVYRLTDIFALEYKAFCSGNIISEIRILSSAHCFLTNLKRRKYNLTSMRVIAGALTTIETGSISEQEKQFRSIKKIFSQYAFRYPIYNLAVLEINKPWNFNKFVNKIGIPNLDMDLEGVCTMASARAVESWYSRKHLSVDEVVVYNKKVCENMLIRSPVRFLCTDHESSKIPIAKESEGSGLICYGTEDPQEVNETGLLVGVLSVINIGLPLLHHRIGRYHQWVIDGINRLLLNDNLLMCLLLYYLYLIVH